MLIHLRRPQGWLSGLRRLSLAVLAGFALLVPASSGKAATLTLDLSVLFGTGTSPEGTAPWLTATFDDSFGGPNDVRLTLSAPGLVDAESAANWFFNFDPTLDPTQLTFTAVNNAASVPNSINTGVNAFMANGDGRYDIMFDFPPPPGSTAARFSSGETVIYDISYVAPIDVSDFNFFSVMSAGAGTFLSASHIERVGPANNLSGWIGAVPEPATALLLGAGLLALGALRRR